MPIDRLNRIDTSKLFLLERIRAICQSEKEIKEVLAEYNDQEIEKILFGTTNKIEEISFPTAHQDVNVYSRLDKKYEIRYDDSAVDIQIKS